MASSMDLDVQPLRPIIVEPFDAVIRKEVELFRARPTDELKSVSERLMRLMDDSVIGAGLYRMTPLQITENFAMSLDMPVVAALDSSRDMTAFSRFADKSLTENSQCGMTALTAYKFALLLARYDKHCPPFMYAQFNPGFGDTTDVFERVKSMVYYSEWKRQISGVGVPIMITVADNQHATMSLWIPSGQARQWIYLHIDTSQSIDLPPSIVKYADYKTLSNQTLHRCLLDMTAASGLTFPAIQQFTCEETLQKHGTCATYSFFVAYDFIRASHSPYVHAGWLKDWCALLDQYTDSDVFEQRIMNMVGLMADVFERTERGSQYMLRGSNPSGVPKTLREIVQHIRSNDVARHWNENSAKLYMLLDDSMTKVKEEPLQPTDMDILDSGIKNPPGLTDFYSSNPFEVALAEMMDRDGCVLLYRLTPLQVTENFFISSRMADVPSNFQWMEQMSAVSIDLVNNNMPSPGQCGGLTASKFVLMVANYDSEIRDKFVYMQYIHGVHTFDTFAARLQCAVYYAEFRRLSTGVNTVLFIHITDWKFSSVIMVIPDEKEISIRQINTGPPSVSGAEVAEKYRDVLRNAWEQVGKLENVEFEFHMDILNGLLETQYVCVSYSIFIAFDLIRAGKHGPWFQYPDLYLETIFSQRVNDLIAAFSKIYAAVPNQSAFAKLRSLFVEDKNCVKCGDLVDIVNQVRSDAMNRAWTQNFRMLEPLLNVDF